MHCCTDRRGIVLQAHQTQAYGLTMGTSFKLSSGTVCLPRFFRFYQCSNTSGTSPQILNFFLHMLPALRQNLGKQTVPDESFKLKNMVWRALSVLKSRLQNAFFQILKNLNRRKQKKEFT